MSEPRHADSLDREISVRGLVAFTAGLVGLLIAAAVLMWALSVGLRNVQRAQDPPPPALPEARRPSAPPGPRLQTDPAAEMVELRAEEERLLGSWEWQDESRTLARIPIERAMELLVEQRAGSAGEASP